MESTLRFFAGTLSVGASLLMAFAAFAQSNAALYCSALIARYETYLSSTGQEVGGGQTAARMAIDECKAGNTKSGIPVLERRLKKAGIELPTHG